MRVFVADAEPQVRSALRIMLVQELGLRVVGETNRSWGLVDRVRTTRPDVVVLDWDLPGPPVADLLPALRIASGRLFVVVLSVDADAEVEAMTLGADAFVSKTDPAGCAAQHGC